MLNLFFRKSEDNMFEDFRLKVFMRSPRQEVLPKRPRASASASRQSARISMHWKRKSALR